MKESKDAITDNGRCRRSLYVTRSPLPHPYTHRHQLFGHHSHVQALEYNIRYSDVHTGSINSLQYKYNNQMVDIMSRPGPLDTLTKCVPAPSLGIIIIILCCRYFNNMSRRDRLPRSSGQAPPLALLLLSSYAANILIICRGGIVCHALLVKPPPSALLLLSSYAADILIIC